MGSHLARQRFSANADVLLALGKYLRNDRPARTPVLRTPVRAPVANSACERFGGSLRRECLDFTIPFRERHLKKTVQEWVTHYNRGRPHSALGPGFPQPALSDFPDGGHRHKLPAGHRVMRTSVLGGLHHEYSLVKEAV